MSKYVTTLRKIKAHNPCGNGWKKLLKSLGKTKCDDEPLELLTILESNGLQDAIWALRTLEGCDREIRLLACQFACDVLPIFERLVPGDMRPRQAIETAALFAEGLEGAAASDVARVAARAAAGDAAGAGAAAWAGVAAGGAAAGGAAWVAAGDAAWAAARAAAWAAGNAGGAAAQEKQKKQMIEMINGIFNQGRRS